MVNIAICISTSQNLPGEMSCCTITSSNTAKKNATMKIGYNGHQGCSSKQRRGFGQRSAHQAGKHCAIQSGSCVRSGVDIRSAPRLSLWYRTHKRRLLFRICLFFLILSSERAFFLSHPFLRLMRIEQFTMVVILPWGKIS
jgi:hypothetical protein